MKSKTSLRRFLCIASSSLLAASVSHAADLFWSGTGDWDTTNQVWGTGSGGTYDQATWDNGNNDTAVFEGTSGTSTLAEAITVGGLKFDVRQIISGNTLTLASGTVIQSNVGNSNGTGGEIGSVLAGTGGFTKTGTGWLNLTATSSSLSGNINLRQGTLYTRHEALGSGAIVFTGDSTLAKVYNANANFTQNITINTGVNATMIAPSFFWNMNHAGVLSGGDTSILTMTMGGNTQVAFNNTVNTFAGQVLISGGGTGSTNGGRVLFQSLADSDEKISISNSVFRLAAGGVSMNFANRPIEILNNNARIANDSTNSAVTLSFAQSLTATIGNTGRTLILSGVNTGNNTFGGDISNSANGSGAVSVTKEEAGTWVLSGANTYTGATNVNGGTLLINGSTSTSVVTVGVNGTLGGDGNVGGATTVSGFLKPGNSAGVLEFGSSLTLNSTAATTMEILGLNRGADYDGVNITTNLTYGGALTLEFGTTFGASHTFNLFDFGTQDGSFDSVTLAGAYSGSLVNTDGVWGMADDDNTWTFTESTGDLSLTVIPEPTAALLALLRRRR